MKTIRIEFDGGTPCNIPRLGYGNGYGSYKIEHFPIMRLNFGTPMSANVAEIRTLIHAIELVSEWGNHASTILEIHGDSKIALNRCKKKLTAKQMKKSSPDFAEACNVLCGLCDLFAIVETHWRGRQASVKLFGH